MLVLALAAAWEARAQEELPRIRGALPGFGGQFRNRHWAPLRVEVENPGPARTGLLVGETVGTFSGQRLQFTRPVFLPANSARQFEIPILPDLPPRSSPSSP